STLGVEFVRGMLRRDPWIEVALHCCFHQQFWALGLRPWGPPGPCRVDKTDDPGVHELANRLRANNLSIYEASPLEALAQAAKPLTPAGANDRPKPPAKRKPKPRKRRR